MGSIWPLERDRSNWKIVSIFSFSYIGRKVIVCMSATCMASVTAYSLIYDLWLDLSS